jgi:hypothetical protein
MGLDTTHNCWNGSYSRFSRFRKALANEIGINLSEYDGFGGTKSWDTLNHGIKPLLNHSDCDGILTVEECKSIITGLNEILAGLDKSSIEEQHFIDQIIQIRDGCIDAVENNEIVEFG